MRQREPSRKLSDSNGPFKQQAIHSSFLCGSLFRLRQNLFINPRYANKDGRVHFAQIDPNLIQRLAEVNAHAMMQIHVHCLPLESMRQRQNRERGITVTKLKMIRRSKQV